MTDNERKAFIAVYVELFTRGEILKAHSLINDCVPLWLQNDYLIKQLREECNNRIDEISKWGEEGRPYNGEYATAPFSGFQKFVLAADMLIADNYGENILDVGCYSGIFLEHMAKCGFTCSGVDVHKSLMELLEKKSEVYFRFAPLHKLPFKKNSFDIVTAFDILEHVIDLDKSISEMERVCKKDGLIIINLPQQTTGYKDEVFEHVRMFSKQDIERIWGSRKNFAFQPCTDELGRPTHWFSYNNA